MVRQVEEDARGIVAPDAGLTRFQLDRYPPSDDVARFVAWYWVVTWDLRGQPSHTQHVFSHPVVNVTFGVDDHADDGLVTGVTKGVTSRTLTGAGRVLGIMFRPAGFRPLLGQPMRTLTGRTGSFAAIVGPAAHDIARAVGAGPDDAAMASAADTALASLLPTQRQRSEETTVLVERIAAEPAFVRVEDLAAEVGTSVRQVERRFADHVGILPKAVIRRYRLYEAAERAREGTRVDWAAVAAELGYSDQAHLTRDFTTSFGLSPGRYVHANQPNH